ncbi:unnamed protein product [Rotaria sp. Silwood1]|nr:unnamed protein product [Rotaria sp. Silwood1]
MCETHEEFVRTMLGGFKRSQTTVASSNFDRHTFLPPSNVHIPSAIDWRQKGAVTTVIENQGQCGSCWAFTATGALEGQHFIKTGQLVRLSAQNLMDCSGDYGNAGCCGGSMDASFQYIKDNNGLDTEASYPYEAVESQCRFNRTTVGATDTGFVDLPSGNETTLQIAIATVGPISVAIDAQHDSFQFYSSGVYDEPKCSSTAISHSFVLVIETLKICQNDPSNELTKQYGFIKFDENKLDTATRLSQYIRLSLTTNAETVVKFMQQGWRLPKPDLIISVTGGAKSFDMSTRLRKIFQSGLVAAAITTNAWLITAGTNAGVVKEVGEAFNKYRYTNRKNGLDVPCIGIASWGYTAGNEQLDCQSTNISTDTNITKGIYPFMRHHHNQITHSLRVDSDDQYLVRNYTVKEKPKKRCDLEPNHTHFLLFDDGQPNADTVLPLRAEIEKYSRNTSIETTTDGAVESLIPIVMVLVEGGPSSIRTICEALDSNTPVVVIKESGRAADLVAELHACYTESENSNGNGYPTRPQTGSVKGGSKEAEINAILAKAQADITGLDEVKSNLCRVLNQHKQLVTIFKFDSKRHRGNLEDAILESLFNAAKFSDDHNEQNRRTAELRLAIAWHKINYAQKYLLTDTTISKWKEDDLRRALVDALHRGYVDFVELLIEFGTSLEKLTNGDLKHLYATTLTSNRLPLKGKGKHVIWTREDFYSDYFHVILYNTNVNNKFPLLDDNMPLGKGAPQDLFLWAIFLDRFELATYLCSKTWNSSIAPLFGSLIYRRAARLELDVDIKQQYEENADQFDTHAMSIIDRCFDNDEHFAVDLLKRPAVAFNNVNPLQLARKVNCKSFLASKCVQKYLDHQWFGYINYKRTAINFRVFLCSLFFPLLPIFCIFLPYIQKHEQIIRSTRDQSKVSQSTMIHNVIESVQHKGKNHVPWSEKIRYFYEAPIVRFYYYMIFFILFLGLFSFVLLVDYFPLNIYNEHRSGIQYLRIPITEIILHICFWSFIIEEIRQFLFVNSKREYISGIWNMIDMIATILYLISFITRFIVLEPLFVVSKIFLCLDLILWYVRTLELFAAFEKLGPKLIMIFNTMKDFLFFVCFILIFFLGYSISSWSLITTDNQVSWNYNNDGSLFNGSVSGGGSGLWTWQILRDVTNFGVWKIFGQTVSFSLDGTDAYSIVAFILTIVFVAISNVLLLNVLIALFNVTIQNVQMQSHRIWRYQRFLLVYEYNNKPPLPPPFNTIYYLYRMILYIIEKIQYYRQNHRHVSDAMQRESAIADDYWSYVVKHGKKDQIEVAVQNIERKLHDLQEQIHDMIYHGPNYDQEWLLSDA